MYFTWYMIAQNRSLILQIPRLHIPPPHRPPGQPGKRPLLDDRLAGQALHEVEHRPRVLVGQPVEVTIAQTKIR